MCDLGCSVRVIFFLPSLPAFSCSSRSLSCKRCWPMRSMRPLISCNWLWMLYSWFTKRRKPAKSSLAVIVSFSRSANRLFCSCWVSSFHSAMRTRSCSASLMRWACSVCIAMAVSRTRLLMSVKWLANSVVYLKKSFWLIWLNFQILQVH